MTNVNTVTQEHEETQDTVKTSVAFPSDLWKEVKKAAVDADKSAAQFVIDTLAEKVLPGLAKRDNAAQGRKR